MKYTVLSYLCCSDGPSIIILSNPASHISFHPRQYTYTIYNPIRVKIPFHLPSKLFFTLLGVLVMHISIPGIPKCQQRNTINSQFLHMDHNVKNVWLWGGGGGATTMKLCPSGFPAIISPLLMCKAPVQ